VIWNHGIWVGGPFLAFLKDESSSETSGPKEVILDAFSAFYKVKEA